MKNLLMGTLLVGATTFVAGLILSRPSKDEKKNDCYPDLCTACDKVGGECEHGMDVSTILYDRTGV